MRSPGLRLGLAVLCLATASCRGEEGRPQLDVLAASSLTEALQAIIPDFERSAGVQVRVRFDGSPAIVRQAVDGAPADVVITADEASLAPLGDRAIGREVMARNRLALVTRSGNPMRLRGLDDLTRATMVMCDPSVPCGRLAQAALSRAGIDLHPASLELNVKAVVAKVALGEADAGIAYVTDAIQAGSRVERVDLPSELVGPTDMQAAYPAVVLSGDRSALARRFVAFLLSAPSQRELAARGFGTP